MSLAEGEAFAGYTIVRLLGSGGMGEVYLVNHPRLPRLDALKILPATATTDTGFRQRFEREADIASGLRHPHIVTIYDRGEFDGQLWMSMEYVEGTDAARLIRDQHPHGLPPADAVQIISAVAQALDYAHNEGLLHRDVKPANILLSRWKSGQPRILLADFGIARKIDDISGLTATNMTVGSVAYAAPEQMLGRPVDASADQYALACTAFHLLVGTPPYPETNPAVVITRHLTSPPPSIGYVHPQLSGGDPALHVALAKDPRSRFPRCEDFAKALGDGLSGRAPSASATVAAITVPFAPRSAPPPPVVPPAPAVPPSPAPAPARSRSRLPMVALVAAIAAALAVAVFVGMRLGGDKGAASQDDSRIAATEPSAPATARAISTPPTPSLGPSVTPSGGTPSAIETPRAENPDLGLSTPISYPACDGTGIVVLGNAVNPANYRGEVQRLLDRFPGASYLRTDFACPSLRQRDDNGNLIYAVYRVAGRTQQEVCAAVNASGGGAYGKWLNTTTDPHYIIPC